MKKYLLIERHGALRLFLFSDGEEYEIAQTIMDEMTSPDCQCFLDESRIESTEVEEDDFEGEDYMATSIPVLGSEHRIREFIEDYGFEDICELSDCDSPNDIEFKDFLGMVLGLTKEVA